MLDLLQRRDGRRRNNIGMAVALRLLTSGAREVFAGLDSGYGGAQLTATGWKSSRADIMSSVQERDQDRAPEELRGGHGSGRREAYG